MTNDFDELLSAYIDGETTPDETARVEADPEMRAAAATMRALAGEVAQVPLPDPMVRSAQLAAAMDAFGLEGSTPVSGVEAGPEGVVSLEGRRAKKEVPRSRGVPSWLGAAAAAVIVVGGAGYALQQATGGSNDSADTASVALDSAEEATDDEASADTEETLEATRSADDGESSGDDMAADESAESGLALEAEEADTVEESEESEPAATTQALTSTTAPGLFPEEIERNRLFFDVAPTLEEQEDLATGELLPMDWSTCGSFITGDGTEPVGFIPVSVDGVSGELLVYERFDGTVTITVLVDGDCNSL